MSKQIQYDDHVLGNARLATSQELNNIGLLKNTGGIVFGRINNDLVEKPPELQGHCLIVGGTGTGKSRGVAIPTLLKWKGAVLAIDVKGELSATTAQYRQNVYIFDPENEGNPYDPLEQCKSIDGANELARSLIPEPQNGDPFWSKTAQAVLAAGALEGALEGMKFTDVIEKLCTTDPEQLIEIFQQSQHKAVRMLSSVGVGMPDKTRGGVFSELRSKILTLGADPNIEKATAYAGWTPKSLEEGATIYLKVSEGMLKQYEGLWTVIISQILRHLSSRPDRSNPPILILLDEFARIGRLPGILDALATLRSRNVHIAIFVQSMAQIDYIYSVEERKIIADNCGFKLVLSATDPETQKYFSDLSGQKTVWVGNQGVSKGKSSSGSIGVIPGSNTNKSQGLSQQGTPLIRPEEFSKLKYPLLFPSGLYPCYVAKAFWDKDPAIAPLVGIRPEKPEKIQSEKTEQHHKKPTGIIILLCVCVLLGFILAAFAFKYILQYSINDPSIQEKLKSGTLSQTEYNSALRGSKDILYMLQCVFGQPKNLKIFAPLWFGGIWITFMPCIIFWAVLKHRRG